MKAVFERLGVLEIRKGIRNFVVEICNTRFDKEMKRVDAMSDEERQANWKKLCEDVDDFCKEWNVTIKI